MSLEVDYALCVIRCVIVMYRWFYNHCSTGFLHTLYLTCIRPHLEYAAALIECLESVQRFACRICCKSWTLSYPDMLAHLGISTLRTRRHIKSCSCFSSQNTVLIILDYSNNVSFPLGARLWLSCVLPAPPLLLNHLPQLSH